MNPARLLAQFERLADAPDAIPRLRRFILDLAVRGKLVEQDPADEPAPELLKRLTKEHSDQANLPRNWRCAPVGLLLDFQYGKGVAASERAGEGPVPVYGSNGVVGYTRTPLSQKPSIIVGRKGSAGALNLCDGPSWTTDVAYFVEAPPFFALRFLFNALAALDLDQLGKGVKPGLSRSDVYEQIVWVPPLAEQHRIVAKVDELMALCDRLEAARDERESRRDRLVTASLYRLGQPADEDGNETFRGDARFYLSHLPRLTTRPEHVKQLRQTILNLAVRGRLVPQDPNDEPAPELLREIEARKSAMQAARRIRADKELRHVSDEEALFPAPRGWIWTRAQDVALKISDGVHKKPHYVREGIPFITVKNITEGSGISFADTKFISEGDHLDFIKRTHPEKGDVLITKDGTIGVARVIETDRVFSIFVSVALVKMVEVTLAPFFALCINSELVRQSIIPKGAALKHLHLVDLRKLPLPLPPLSEQHRILARVHELMALCDRLEASLAESEADSRRLLEAVLHEALQAAESALEAAD